MSLNLWMRMYFWDWREAGFCWNLSTKLTGSSTPFGSGVCLFLLFRLVHSVGFFFEIQCHLIPYNCLFVTVQFNKNLLASRGIKFRPQKNPAEEERERWRVAHWAWEWQLQCVVETFFSASQCVEGKSMNMAEAGDFILLNHSGRFRFPCNTIRWADRLSCSWCKGCQASLSTGDSASRGAWAGESTGKWWWRNWGWWFFWRTVKFL